MNLKKWVWRWSVPVLGASLAAASSPQPSDAAQIRAASSQDSVLLDVQNPEFLPSLKAPDVQASSVLVYIKVVIQKEFGWAARNLGGMRDHTWRRTLYKRSNRWWENPLIVHSDPPIFEPDLIVGSNSASLTGEGSSKNVKVRVNLVPHADVSVKTIPRSDAVEGTITCVIAARASYYDGRWVEMVHEVDRTVTFNFDTRDPAQAMEVMDVETRRLPLFEFERYTRDQIKWEPQSRWPSSPVNGDWHVVIYGQDAVLKITRYRHMHTNPVSRPMGTP